RERWPQTPSAAPYRNPRSISRCWTRLAFSMSRRSSCCGAVTVSTDSGTVTGADEISVWGGKSEASGDVLRRITMGMRGLEVTLRLLSGCWRDVVVSSEVDVEVPAVGVETLSGEPVMRSGSQRAAEKETRNTTIEPTIHNLASAMIGPGDIVRPEPLALRPGRQAASLVSVSTERIRAPSYKTRCGSKVQPSGKNLFLPKPLTY